MNEEEEEQKVCQSSETPSSDQLASFEFEFEFEIEFVWLKIGSQPSGRRTKVASQQNKTSASHQEDTGRT